MYTKEELIQYPYFAEKLKETGPDSLLDQLTGLISRGHILWFAQWLIEQRIPFSFAMLDLDNFKFINDTYGHHVGDQVLVHVAEDLAAYLAGFGLAGRFGGDEFLIINLRDVTYDANKAFFIGMYDGKVLRKNIRLEECNPFITGTIGCAIYPKDAADYNGLFELIDKTLYRGKSKGRNCHIIYVEEKHRDIVIRQIARHGMYTTFSGLLRQFEFAPGLVNKLRSVMPLRFSAFRSFSWSTVTRPFALYTFASFDHEPRAFEAELLHLVQALLRHEPLVDALRKMLRRVMHHDREFLARVSHHGNPSLQLVRIDHDGCALSAHHSSTSGPSMSGS